MTRTGIIALFAIFLLASSATAHGFLERVSPGVVVSDDVELIKDLYAKSPAYKEKFERLRDSARAAAKNGTCINGKDNLSTKEQLLEFVQGPCSPLVVSPGLFGSKLTVSIDCETLKNDHPDVFSQCGWESCADLGGKKPKDEYTIWVAEFEGPLDFLIPKTSNCWGNFIEMQYNPDEPDITKKFTTISGANVSVYGTDANTKADQRCGFAAIDDMLPLPIQYSTTYGWIEVRKDLEELGYQVGLTLYAVPYDWRKTTMANRAGDYIVDTLKQSYNLTGKPAVMASHSLGNFGMYTSFTLMTQAEKDQLVANWISIMPPLPGAGQALNYAVAGDWTWNLNQFAGMSHKAMSQLLATDTSLMDLIPKDTMERFQNEQWMIDWATRQGLEDKYDVKTPEGKAEWEKLVQSGDYPMKWFPDPLQLCSKGFTQRPDHCFMGTYNWSSAAAMIFPVDGQNYTFTASHFDIETLMNQYNALIPQYNSLKELSKTNRVYEMLNPNVTMTILYGSHLNTTQGHYYTENVYTRAKEGKYNRPNRTIFTPGDNTVPTASALIPAFKWAWEFENKVENSKPLKFLEWCGTLNQKGTVYDKLDPNSPYVVESLAHMGLDCDCLRGTDIIRVSGATCNHGDAPQDKKIREIIKNTVYSNTRVSDYSNTGANLFSEQQLEEIAQNCPAVNHGSQYYWTLLEEVLASIEEQKNEFVEEIIY